MAEPAPDEDFLLALLNSTPVIEGVPTDDLADPARARAWLASAGGAGEEGGGARQEPRRASRTSPPARSPGPCASPRSAGWPSAPSWPGTPWPGSAPDGCVRAPTTNAACSSSTAPRTTPP